MHHEQRLTSKTLLEVNGRQMQLGQPQRVGVMFDDG
jgi:hypothetical protein